MNLINKNILVSIGLPIYNSNKNLLNKVIKSLVNQTYKNIELIISDNNSEETLFSIINKYKKNDKRIFYYKQKKNIGGEKNRLFVLKKAKGKYFLYSADDDIISYNFVEKNLLFLERNPNYVGSISPARFHNYKFKLQTMGDQSLEDDNPLYRAIKSINSLHANARYRSLFIKEALIKCFKIYKVEFLWNDYFLIFKLLFIGKLKRINQGYMIMGKKGTSSSLKNIMNINQMNYFSIFFAFNKIYKNILFFLKKKKIEFNYYTKLYIFLILFKINIKYVYVNLFKVNFYNSINKLLK